MIRSGSTGFSGRSRPVDRLDTDIFEADRAAASSSVTRIPITNAASARVRVIDGRVIEDELRFYGLSIKLSSSNLEFRGMKRVDRLARLFRNCT